MDPNDPNYPHDDNNAMGTMGEDAYDAMGMMGEDAYDAMGMMGEDAYDAMDPNDPNYPHDDNNAMSTMGEDAYDVMGMGTDLSTDIDDNEMKKLGGFFVSSSSVAGTKTEYEKMRAMLPLGARWHGAGKLRGEGLTGRGVKVAVIDTGVPKDHAGFNGKVIDHFPSRKEGEKLHPHGTHVAGTIHYMAPDVEIIDYCIIDENKIPNKDFTLIMAIDQAVADGCDIINMSLEWKAKETAELKASVEAAHKAGVIMVASSGNYGDLDVTTNENSYPAFFPECISVGAVSKWLERSGEQLDLPIGEWEIGEFRYSTNSNDEVDYAGIGVRVESFARDGGHRLSTGTSMACPHVCGLIACLMTKGGVYSDSIRNDASCRQLLNRYCIDIGTEGRDNHTGLGFLTYLTRDELEKEFKLDLNPIKGTYRLQSMESNLFLNINTRDKRNGGKIYQWDNPQEWILQEIRHDKGQKVVSIKSKESGLYLNINIGAKRNGGKIHQWDYDQEWAIENYGKIADGTSIVAIRSIESGLYLSISTRAERNGGKIHQWNYPQKWKLIG